MKTSTSLAWLAATSIFFATQIAAPANADEDQRVTVQSSVQCDSEHPSGIIVINPPQNTRSFYLQSEVSDASGVAQFGDGGLIAPGESFRIASSGSAVTVEDASYSYVVSQSPASPGSDGPTEPFTEIATGTYVFDCETPTDYFVTSYDGTVWAIDTTSISALSYAQWQDLGFPQPRPAPTDYVKYRWSSTISAVTFFGTNRDRWVWKHVSLSEWQRAGTPAPRHAGWIKDSSYYQWEGSSQIFVQDVGGVKHALSSQEWADSGWEPFAKRSNQGFAKLSWDANIAFLHDWAGGRGGPIGSDQWHSEGYPTPYVAARFPGDQLYRNYGDPTIRYAGPTVSRPITYTEWTVMGRPAPVVQNVPPRPSDKDCRDYPSWRAAQDDYNYYYEAYGDVFDLDGDGDGIACESYFRI